MRGSSCIPIPGRGALFQDASDVVRETVARLSA
jgi:hypothetical protein